MYKILFADDENKIRETVSDYLTAKGFDISLAENGQEAVDMAYEKPFDLIILDVMMPETNGIEACKEIRQELDTPIMFLSALGEEEHFLKGYKSGADDYIVKPFPLSVLYEKCMTMIKRHKRVDEDQILSVSGITLDTAKVKVTVDGVPTDISGKDFQILEYLMRNKDVVISREKLLTNIWGFDCDVDTRVIDTHVKRIRKMLGDRADLIKTIINVGYKFEEVE